MKGRIISVNGGGTLYGILVKEDGGGIFNIPVEHRYFSRIIEDKGDIVGKEIEYEDERIYFIEDF
jgi:galactokinase/mevalonate kinase-like predicted kinase